MLRSFGLTGLATVLIGFTLPVAFSPPASADVINGCDVHEDYDSPACLAFDSDGDGWVEPDVEITGPVDAVVAGRPFVVTATGTDLLRPVTVGIHHLATELDEEATPANQVSSVTVGPGAMTATVTLPAPATRSSYAAYVDDYDAAGVYVDDYFNVDVLPVPPTASSLTSDLPPGRIVKVHSKAQAVTGKVSGGPRPVHLQVRAKDGSWVSVAETTSTASGSYALGLPTFWVGKHTYRTHAPEHGTFAAADGTRSGNLTVQRTYRPKGSKAHNLMFGRAARWNACAPIRYGFNTATMPKWARSEVRYALREVSAATGLRFTAGATTTHVPFARKRTTFPENLDLVFAFSTPKKVPGLTGSTIGLGGASVSSNVIFNGGVTLDVAQRTTKKEWREIVLHETGHAIGLGHVNDRRQIMFPIAAGKHTRFSKGDLTGLTALGAGAGACTGESSFRGDSRATHRPAPGAEVRRVVLP